MKEEKTKANIQIKGNKKAVDKMLKLIEKIVTHKRYYVNSLAYKTILRAIK